MTIPKNISYEHIIKAIQQIDREGVPKGRELTKYYLLRDKYYPSKYVISIANTFANGEQIPFNKFNGEEANEFLVKLGFCVSAIQKVEKHSLEYQQQVAASLDIEEIAVDDSMINVLATINTDTIELTKTEKEQIIKSRIGQSAFKKALLAIEKKCNLCGVSDERFLIASHIKPWSQSNNQERLDVNNGLLLCPNHDALFDRGYISFDDDGTIMTSFSLDEATMVFLNTNETLNIRMNEGQRDYMRWHRGNIFKK